MIRNDEVFEAIRRGYTDLKYSNDEDIISYFKNLDEDSITGHINNIKGILFEQEYIDKLTDEGVNASIFEATNHPITDIKIYDENNGEIINEIQLKATDSVSYINETLNENPDIQIVATTEVAQLMNNDMVIDSGISNDALEEIIIDTILPFGTTALLLGGIGLLFGLPF